MNERSNAFIDKVLAERGVNEAQKASAAIQLVGLVWYVGSTAKTPKREEESNAFLTPIYRLVADMLSEAQFQELCDAVGEDLNGATGATKAEKQAQGAN